jgi:hypothetical protein
MKAAEFVADLACRDIRLSVGDDGTLVVDAPPGALTRKDRDTLLLSKSDVLLALATPDPGSSPDHPMIDIPQDHVRPVREISPIGDIGPVPAWVLDDSLTVSLADVRASLDLERDMGRTGLGK